MEIETETEAVEIVELGKVFTSCVAINRTIIEAKLLGQKQEKISLAWRYINNKRIQINEVIRENRSFMLIAADEQPPVGAIRMQLKSEDYKLFFLPNVKAQQLD